MPSPPPEEPSETDAPASKRWRERVWWVRYLSYGAGLVSLLVVAYLGYAIWAHFQWKAYVTEIEGSGSSLDLATLLSPPDTAGEGFWDSEIVRQLRREDGAPFDKTWETLEIAEPRIDFMAFKTDPDAVRKAGSWTYAHPNVLTAYFSGESFSRTQAAEALLQAMKVFDNEFKALAEAASRPLKPFQWKEVESIAEGDPKGALTLSKACEILALRGVCRLELGEAELALADLTTLLRMSRQIAHEGTLIDQMVAMVIRNRGFQIAWEGLKTGAWNESQLTRLDQQIAQSLSTLPPFSRTLEIERAFAFQSIESSLGSPGIRWEFSGGYFAPDMSMIEFPHWFTELPPLDSVAEFINRALFAAVPLDVYRLSLPLQQRIQEESLLNLALSLPDRIDREKQLADASRSSGTFRNPSTVLTQMGFGSFCGRLEGNVALLEALRAAVAVERYRLAESSVPKTWSDLVPDWLPAIPQDPWSGSPLVYQLDKDRRPVIYSIGPDQIDENGTPHRRSTQGDLVWRYSLPVGMSLDDYLKR